jgi:hypothetical protein
VDEFFVSVYSCCVLAVIAEAKGMAEFLSCNRLAELWMMIEQLHLSYLQTDESLDKIEQRSKLEGNYSCVINVANSCNKCVTFYCCYICMFIRMYIKDEKRLAKLTDGESTTQNKKIDVCERRPSEAWFPSYGLLMINGNAESVHLECQCRMLHV